MGLPAASARNWATEEADCLRSVTKSMTVGELFLGSITSGVITHTELSWLTHQQGNFSRVEEATALRLGRLLDQGSIQLGCRLHTPTLSDALAGSASIDPQGLSRHF